VLDDLSHKIDNIKDTASGIKSHNTIFNMHTLTSPCIISPRTFIVLTTIQMLLKPKSKPVPLQSVKNVAGEVIDTAAKQVVEGK
jgi:hypothetical protein